MDRIRELRNLKGVSQAKLAVMAGMDPATLNRIEQGKGNPNLKTLGKLADALEVTLVELLEGEPKKAQAPLPFDNPLEDAEERRLRYLYVLQEFAADMNKVWTLKVEKDSFSEEEFENGVNVFNTLDNAYVTGIGTDLLGALSEGTVVLPTEEQEALDHAKASIDAWQRTMWSAYDALKIRGVPNVTKLSKIRGQRKHNGQSASVQNTREPAEEARNQSSA